MDWLAGIERFWVGSTRSSQYGVQAGCIFCSGRGAEVPKVGQQIIFLNGYRAGTLGKILESSSDEHSTFRFAAHGNHSSLASTANPKHDLFVTLPVEALPQWLPPFNLQRAFIVDELAVWFCDSSFVGESFHWIVERLVPVAHICWSKRLAITSHEMTAVMLAHGMPSERQAEFEDRFALLIAAYDYEGPRKRVKKWRDQTSIMSQVSEAMRYWGR